MSQWIRPTTRWAVYLRDGLQCAYCMRTIAELLDADDGNFLTVDHAVARSRGGGNGVTNLVTSCYECNVCKGKSSLQGFCKTAGLSYSHVRQRVHRRKAKPIDEYRYAAAIVLGIVDGFAVSPLVVRHDTACRSQWGGEMDKLEQKYLDRQSALWCTACNLPLSMPDREESLYSTKEETIPF